jgi:hypothetical protein
MLPYSSLWRYLLGIGDWEMPSSLPITNYQFPDPHSPLPIPHYRFPIPHYPFPIPPLRKSSEECILHQQFLI